MTIDQMRKAIMVFYPSTNWQNRVIKMMPNQVIAIYRRMQREGWFDGRTRKAKEMKTIKQQEENHQITLWEWANDNQIPYTKGGFHGENSERNRRQAVS